jgi:hypothetical protein
MAMPVPEKTWVFDTNNLVNTGTVAGDMKALIFALKTAMVAAGWTVQLSSDATSSGAADYWIDTGDLNWGTTGARSWIVLRNDNLGPTHLEILLECKWYSSSYPTHLAVRYAPAGDYAGGNTTTAPTCSNEQTLAAPAGNYEAAFISNGPANCGPRFWHYMNSNDGQCHRFFMTQGGIVNCLLMFERIKNPVAGLAASDQFVIAYYPDKGNISISGGLSKTTTAVFNAVSTYLKSYVAGSGAAAYFMTGEFCGAGSKPINDLLLAPNPNDADSWPLFPIGLVTITNTAWAYGRNGELFDMWWGSTSRLTGYTYPADGSREFIQVGEMVFPWDGSKPRVVV